MAAAVERGNVQMLVCNSLPVNTCPADMSARNCLCNGFANSLDGVTVHLNLACCDCPVVVLIP